MNLSKIAVGVAVSLCLTTSFSFANSYDVSIEKKVTKNFKETYNKYVANIKDDTIDIDKLDKFSEEQRKGILESYGYYNSVKGVTFWKSSKNRLDLAHYYALKTLNNEINENKEKLDKNLEEIKIANEAISKVNSEKASTEVVKKNTTDIASNKKLIEDNKKNIDANKSSIEGNKKLILEMNDKIALNHKSIQDVKSQLNARLDNLNKDLRRGLATQSALTGLFQPYSVGKMNVTAAVGGYQSEKAIAVGSGYRFNDNFAAKVGLSKSLGGSAVSYNMGVNYEF
ncbi:hypothetical protein PcPA57_00340 [Pasteurella canis]|uniref:YadA C-terminal domain-containing protein n=1 Tax=Pasteurella canis TaxID=753 RepID=UPI001E5776BB|nr:YadA C-terminal domain-containing protein [Pasteurella canis]GJJ79314.1 hypothetical protein PcPA57_00340 [Pasteurella canis]